MRLLPSQKFALEFFLSDYPDGIPFNQIVDLILDCNSVNELPFKGIMVDRQFSDFDILKLVALIKVLRFTIQEAVEIELDKLKQGAMSW